MKGKKRRYKSFTAAKYICEALKMMLPPEDLTVSQWAERYRINNNSAIAGKWRNSVTPYMVGVMDAISDWETERVIFCKPSQVGGSEGLLNMLGYTAMQDPSPCMVVMPDDDACNYMSGERIQPMLRDCPELAERFHEGSSNLKNLQLDGMYITLASAHSPTELASRPICKLFIDEVDKFPFSTKREADPISLAIERTKTFPNRKIYIDSTPTTRNGHIWKYKENADVEKHYFIPCSHCGEFIELEFKQIKWPSRDTGLSDKDRAEQAVYVCQKCGAVISDADKMEALQAGEWRAVRQSAVRKRSVAFWINTLYSPFVRFSDIALEWYDAQGDPDGLHNFYNSWLALPWEETRQRTSADVVLERQTDVPRGIVPDWTLLLTAGVDIQPDRYYWSIRAWGENLTSQNVAHGMCTDVGEFAELERIMNINYPKQNGETMLVDCCFIDSGYNTLMIYDFCAINADWAIPCKGSNTELMSGIARHTIDRAESSAYGMPLYYVDGGKYKDIIAARMNRQNGAGAWMVYDGCDEEYAKQVTAEHSVIERDKRGVERRVWKQKVSHGDNHYLDCEVYAFAAADYKGVRSLFLRNQQEQPTADETQQNQNNEESWIRVNENWI